MIPSTIVINAQQAMSIQYNNLVYEMQQRDEKIIVLSLGEAFFDIPLFPIDDLPFPDIYHYSHSRGIPELREKIARYYFKHYGVHVDPASEIMITAGSKAAIYFSLLSLLNPGDEAIMQEPTWVSYPEQVRLCHATPVMMPYDAPTTDYERYITANTKIIIINNPHNPRGEVFSRKDLCYLVDLARSNGLAILADEAYSDFLLKRDFCSLGVLDGEKKHVIVVNSISKNFGISGWRLGYAIAQAGFIDQILKVNQHIITCAPTILQHYLVKHFEEIVELTFPQIAQVVAKREQVSRFMDLIGLHYLDGSATFYFFVSIEPSALGSEEFCVRLLQEDHVSVVPGIGYGRSCDTFVRVSVGTESLEDIQYGITKLKELIDRTRKHG